MVREYTWRFVGSAGLVWRRDVPFFCSADTNPFVSGFCGHGVRCFARSLPVYAIVYFGYLLALAILTYLSIQLLMADCPLHWGHLITLSGARQLRLVLVRPLQHVAKEFESHCCSSLSIVFLYIPSLRLEGHFCCSSTA